MITIFKTSVCCKYSVILLEPYLNKLLPDTKWNFDLDDCDNILRIESRYNVSDKVISGLKSIGYDCEELE